MTKENKSWNEENEEGQSFSENLEGQDAEDNLGEDEEIHELSGSKKVDAELEKLREENARFRDQTLRALADAENTRKRAERDVEDAAKYSIVSFARDMINVLENLNRAEQNIPLDEIGGNQAFNNFIQGIELTKKDLMSGFEKHGIKRVDPLGEKFDHNFHQAVAQVESADKEPGTVISVVQAGYTIRDRLLRPAMVAVTKAPEPRDENGSVDEIA